MNEFAINWIFMIDTLNFSFWSDHELATTTQLDESSSTPSVKTAPVEKYTVVYNHVPYSGYLGFCAAVNRALDVSCRTNLNLVCYTETFISSCFEKGRLSNHGTALLCAHHRARTATHIAIGHERFHTHVRHASQGVARDWQDTSRCSYLSLYFVVVSLLNVSNSLTPKKGVSRFVSQLHKNGKRQRQMLT